MNLAILHHYNSWTGCRKKSALRWQEKLCHTEELISHPYEISILLLCPTDEMFSPTYEIATDFFVIWRS